MVFSFFLFSQDQVGSQRAISLPSSPHVYRGQTSDGIGHSAYGNDELTFKWTKVLESFSLNDKPLLPYPEWNIDYSELTVGIRIGIGEDVYILEHVVG